MNHPRGKVVEIRRWQRKRGRFFSFNDGPLALAENIRKRSRPGRVSKFLAYFLNSPLVLISVVFFAGAGFGVASCYNVTAKIILYWLFTIVVVVGTSSALSSVCSRRKENDNSDGQDLAS